MQLPIPILCQCLQYRHLLRSLGATLITIECFIRFVVLTFCYNIISDNYIEVLIYNLTITVTLGGNTDS